MHYQAFFIQFNYNLRFMYLIQYIIITRKLFCSFYFMIHRTQSTTHPMSSKINLFFVMILFFACLLDTSQSKEIILMDSLQQKSDIIHVKLFQEINTYVQMDRSILGVQYTCKSVLKNQLTKNSIEMVQDLKISIDYPKSVFMDGPMLPTFTQEQTKKIQAVNKVLELLKGMCLYYSTDTFLYQYCHKEHVRQFDSHTTFINNAKPEYEDINLGVFQPQTYESKKQRWLGKVMTVEQIKKTLPTKYNKIMYYEHKNMNIQSLQTVSFDKIELEQSQNGQLLHSNTHLTYTDGYLSYNPIILQLTCEQYSNNIRKQIQNYAMVASPFDLIYTLKNDKCHKLISYQILPLGAYPGANQRLRVYGNYLYGNVQQICTQNWAWSKDKQNKQFNNELLEGSLIYLQAFDIQSKKYQRHYMTIKNIINGELIELDAPFGLSFKIYPEYYKYFSYSTLKTNNNFINITKCEILFNKNISFDQLLSQPTIFSNGIIKFPQEQPLISSTNNIGCICQLQPHIDWIKIVDLDIQLGKLPFLNYYQGYFSTNTNLFPENLLQKYIIPNCKKMMCYPFKNEEEEKESSSQSSEKAESSGKLRRFTQIVKLSKKTRKIFNFTSENLQKIYVLNIKGNGILKLITLGKDDQIYTYLISQGQIIKIRQYENGTKEIIKENTYYENMTDIPEILRDNYIYLKLTKLKDGRYYGGIWKVSDYLFFPRFQLLDQVFLSFEIVSGYTYLRILDPVQMVKPEVQAIIQYFKRLQDIYDIKKKSEQGKQDEYPKYFDTSYKLSYEYVSGKYCDAPVNQFRKTLVTLKCGPSWFSIVKVNEKSPCNYYIEIETTLLCRQGFKTVVEQDASVISGLYWNNGMICHPKVGLYDQAFPYFNANFRSS